MASSHLYTGIKHGLWESVLSEHGKNAEFITVRMNCKPEGTGFEVNPSLWSSGKGTGGK